MKKADLINNLTQRSSLTRPAKLATISENRCLARC